MQQITTEDLLNAGVHYGHLTRKWHPAMAPYIFMEKNGIHLVDVNQTMVQLNKAAHALKQIAKSGKKILFVSTKNQFRDIIVTAANKLNMPYVTERWLGGMLTNFSTIRKSIKKLSNIEKMMTENSFENISKKEKLMISRNKLKLERVLKGIADLNRLPAAIFVVDIKRESIAIREAQKLNIPTFAIVDTNSDPGIVDFVIPANDDASTSVALLTSVLFDAIEEGLTERRREKEETGKPIVQTEAVKETLEVKAVSETISTPAVA
ncbi:MAG: 30S ribosomal protein S2 [Bacteroidetes bacterium RIFCSPLOWO2_02_FULL_36_8]|nr:MAG: 30S ribosomal protein S2 [Bacteroidetes bacterium RIFCSPLOWO2_02_FULL_36_8]OFY69706.1 MAG: 30S ribosomal protein S2 [Bacteroidetes bacterium RIFCSPLOWO2_12_FULL_37_12]